MKDIIEKLKKVDKKIWFGVGAGAVVVILLIIFLFMGGKKEDDPEKNNSHTNISTESGVLVDDINKTEEGEKILGEDETQSNEIQKSTEDIILEGETESSEDSKEESQASQTVTDNKTFTSNTTPSTPSKSEQTSSTPSKSEQTSSTPSKSEQTPSTSSKPEQTPSTSEEDTEEEPQQSESSQTAPATEEYTVNVFSAGGHKFYNVKVNVYADKSMTELVETASTNRNGKATLELVPSKSYVFTLSNVPKGYQLSSSYSFSGKTALVVLNSSLITDEDMSGTKLKVGNVMYDFTVPGANGREIKLSDILKNKKMVMLNFWYVNCEFCVKEFPAMSSAYNQYKEDIEIIALNPFDSMDSVKTFLTETPLPFRVATCSTSLPGTFGISAYPVSVVIDQYGVIREIENGAILEEEGFTDIFSNYVN